MSGLFTMSFNTSYPALSEMTVDEIKNISSLQKEINIDGT